MPILQEDETGAQNQRKRSSQQVQQPQIGHPNADRNGFEMQYSQRVKRRKLSTLSNANEFGTITNDSVKIPGDKRRVSDQ